MTAINIITYPQKIGVTDYLPADKVEVEELSKLGLLNDRLIDLLRDQQKIAVATPENYRIAVQRRPAGSAWPPLGFTEAFLVERGFIDGPAARTEPPRKPGKESTPVTTIAITPEAIHVGDYRLQPLKRGNFVFWTAATADGKILRATSFKKSDAGVKFLEELSTRAGAAGTPGPATKADPADDRDLRSGAEHSEG